jgi:hypothetical protein
MSAKDLLPYGIGLLLALAFIAAYFWLTASSIESDIAPTLPDVYNVL